MRVHNMMMALALAGVALRLPAGTLYWDPDGDASNNNLTTGAGLGGNGSWSAASAWWDGTSAVNQAWVAGSDVVLTGAVGRAQLGAAVSAGSLWFGTGGYIVDLCPAAGGAANGYDLSIAGIGGANGEVMNSSQSSASPLRTFTLTVPAGETNIWGGRIYSGRQIFTKAGAGAFVTSGQTGVISAWGQPTLGVTGGLLQFVGNAGCNASGCRIDVAGSGVLDTGNNVLSSRSITSSSAARILSSGSSSAIMQNSQYDHMRCYGQVSGPITLSFSDNGNGNGVLASAANDYSGGTVVNPTRAGTFDLRVQADRGLGSGRVRMENGSVNTSRLNLHAAAPVLGSLESSGAGAKLVILGASPVALAAGALKGRWTSGQNVLTVTVSPWSNVTLGLAPGQVVSAAAGMGIPGDAVITEVISASQVRISAIVTATRTADTAFGVSAVNATARIGALSRPTDTFGGSISEAAGAVGSVTKVGMGEWVLAGANAYSGTTGVESGTLRLTGSLASGRIQVAGGAFTGPSASGTGNITFRLGSDPDGIVMTAGSIDLSRLSLSLTGEPTEKSYTLVDYSAGGALTTATADAFAAVNAVPAGYGILHDTAARRILLVLPPPGTMILLR